MGPLVYMRSTASRKFKSFKGLKKKMTLTRNLTAHASVGTTVKTDAVYTRLWWSTHFRTHSTRAAKPDTHRGQAIASINEADRDSNTRECGKAALT